MLRGGGWSDFKVANATGIFGCDCDVERGPGVGRGGRFFELGEAAAHDDAEDDHLWRDALLRSTLSAMPVAKDTGYRA